MNVLVALAWPNHVHHAMALQWFGQTRDEGWATCPLTELGFVRVSSNTRVIPDARHPGEVIALLGKMRQLPGHVFWADDVSPTLDETGVFQRVVGYRQMTDAHLIALAHRHGGRLATFGRGIEELAGSEARGLVERIAAG